VKALNYQDLAGKKRFFDLGFGDGLSGSYIFSRGAMMRKEGLPTEQPMVFSGGDHCLFFKIHFHQQDGAGRPLFHPCPSERGPLE
jgi:hypothetical protein